MKFLSESEENCLQFLLNRKDNVGFGNEDEVFIDDIKGEEFAFAHFLKAQLLPLSFERHWHCCRFFR